MGCTLGRLVRAPRVGSVPISLWAIQGEISPSLTTLKGHVEAGLGCAVGALDVSWICCLQSCLGQIMLAERPWAVPPCKRGAPHVSEGGGVLMLITVRPIPVPASAGGRDG